MKRKSTQKKVDELRREYDLTTLKGGIRGKYYKRATAGTNLVLIDPDLAKRFPDSQSVNRALRLLLDAAGIGQKISRVTAQKIAHG
jgi:hypothetical protein